MPANAKSFVEKAPARSATNRYPGASNGVESAWVRWNCPPLRGKVPYDAPNGSSGFVFAVFDRFAIGSRGTLCAPACCRRGARAAGCFRAAWRRRRRRPRWRWWLRRRRLRWWSFERRRFWRRPFGSRSVAPEFGPGCPSGIDSASSTNGAAYSHFCPAPWIFYRDERGNEHLERGHVQRRASCNTAPSSKFGHRLSAVERYSLGAARCRNRDCGRICSYGAGKRKAKWI
jgi:hypothetical protein